MYKRTYKYNAFYLFNTTQTGRPVLKKYYHSFVQYLFNAGVS